MEKMMNNIELIKEEILDNYGFDNLKKYESIINMFPKELIVKTCYFAFSEGLDCTDNLFSILLNTYLMNYCEESKTIFNEYISKLDLSVDILLENEITIIPTRKSDKDIAIKLLNVIKSDPIINKLHELFNTKISIYED